MSEPDSTRKDKLASWLRSDQGSVVLIFLVLVLLVDGLGWFANGGLFVLIREFRRALDGADLIEFGDNSFMSISILIGLLATFEISEIFEWKTESNKLQGKQLVTATMIYLLLMMYVSQNIFDLTFSSIGYQRCELEERIGGGKFRFRLIRFAREPIFCPQPKPVAALSNGSSIQV